MPALDHFRSRMGSYCRAGVSAKGFLAAGLFLVGCGEAVPLPGADDLIETTAAIVTPPPIDFQDASGFVRIRVKTCDASPVHFTNCAYCVPDAGWGRIGGGARIYNQPGANAFLQASYPTEANFTIQNDHRCTGPVNPLNDASVWVVRASGGNHQLQPYVLEMQLHDANGNAFVPDIRAIPGNPVDATNPPATFSTFIEEGDNNLGGADHYLIGGGAFLFKGDGQGEGIYTATDSYLVESRPMNAFPSRWQAGARAQHAGASESMKVYGIAVEACPPKLGACLTYPVRKEVSGGASTGYSIASYATPSPWVSTGPGGFSASGTSGASYLASILPLTGSSLGFAVGGKTYTSGSSTTYGYTLDVGILPSFFNAAIFIQGGGLFRPSGTNPTLQRTNAFLDTAASRWSLEFLGNNTYRLRNGNPGAGGECAYRDGATSAVRVTTCGNTNAFKWSLIGGVGDVFQIKNLSSTSCLDNNGVLSGPNSNLVLKACVSGGSASQQMFLDRFSWPSY